MPVHVGMFDISSIKNNDSCMGGDPDTPHPLTILLTLDCWHFLGCEITNDDCHYDDGTSAAQKRGHLR